MSDLAELERQSIARQDSLLGLGGVNNAGGGLLNGLVGGDDEEMMGENGDEMMELL